ncbi:hypothetical protein C0J45_9911 [Silurus meridionalis]|nr:hypothetical protein C0J45_9911 [Silurus meridionalis]
MLMWPSVKMSLTPQIYPVSHQHLQQTPPLPPISQGLKWDNHIDSSVKTAQQKMFFLHQLRKFNLPQELLTQFYSAIMESVLCTSETIWFWLRYTIRHQ